MTDVQYRPYQPSDAEDVKQLVNQAFSIDRYVKAPRLLAGAKEVYLRTCLTASSYTQVAVVEGKVVGVIMGRVRGEPRLPDRLNNQIATAWEMLKLAVLGINEYASLAQFFKFNTVYKQLKADTKAPTTDELTLFAVDANTQGMGVGKTLYNNYMNHLREKGRNDFYLYTDSRCNVGFYEHQGMTRVASQDMTIRLDGKPETLGVYLYTGTTRSPVIEAEHAEAKASVA